MLEIVCFFPQFVIHFFIMIVQILVLMVLRVRQSDNQFMLLLKSMLRDFYVSPPIRHGSHRAAAILVESSLKLGSFFKGLKLQHKVCLDG